MLKGKWHTAHRKGGRPRKADWGRIADLIGQGRSYREIEVLTGINRGSVSYAARAMGLKRG